MYLLAVDIAHLPSCGRWLLDLAERERSRWLAEAALSVPSALVLITDEAVEFYTGETDHLLAIRPQLRLLAEQTRGVPEFCGARIIEQTGTRALRRVMNFAAGLWTDARGAHRAAVEIQNAAALATAQHTLCPMLTSLFQAAAAVGGRVAHESVLHEPRLCAGARDLEIPNVERIIEEELANFGMRDIPRLRHPLAMVTPQAVRSSASAQSEPMSQSRLRIAVPVDLQILYCDAKTKGA